MIEIEHKFLIKNDGWRISASEGTRFQQGYISTVSGTAVRVRIAGDKGFLTLKGASRGAAGISRTELEYEVPLAEAQAMIDEFVDTPVVDKLRYLVNYEGKAWEIDIFSGDNDGLAIAEIELESADEVFAIPEWVGTCVSSDPRYSNYSLATSPYKDW